MLIFVASVEVYQIVGSVTLVSFLVYRQRESPPESAARTSTEPGLEPLNHPCHLRPLPLLVVSLGAQLPTYHSTLLCPNKGSKRLTADLSPAAALPHSTLSPAHCLWNCYSTRYLDQVRTLHLALLECR